VGSNVGTNLHDPTFLSKILATRRQLFCWKLAGNLLFHSNKGTRHFSRRLNFSKSARYWSSFKLSVQDFLYTANLRVTTSLTSIEMTTFYSHFAIHPRAREFWPACYTTNREILISNVKSIEHPRNLSIAKAKPAARVIPAFPSFRIAPI
jgi:hypothetical protein